MPSLASIVIGLAALSATAFATVTGAEVDMELAKRAPGDYPDRHHDHGHHGHGRRPHRHPANYGARCRASRDCYYWQPYTTPVCNRRGRCDYTCPRGWVKKGRGCAPAPKPRVQSCTYDHNCAKTTVKNAHSVCLSRECAWECNEGFYASKGACVPVASRCGQRKDRHGAIIPWSGEKCKAVEDGYNVCVRDRCVPQCEGYLGFSLFTDGEGNYRCVNLLNDPYNCGSIDNECGPGYNGLGRGICYRGTCTVNCHGYGRPRQLPNGQYYCSTL